MAYSAKPHPTKADHVVISIPKWNGSATYNLLGEVVSYNQGFKSLTMTDEKRKEYDAAYLDYCGEKTNLYKYDKPAPQSTEGATPTVSKRLGYLLRKYRTSERAWEQEDEEAYFILRDFEDRSDFPGLNL